MKTNNLTFITALSAILSTGALAQNFETEWVVPASDLEITIPIHKGVQYAGDYHYNVDWGDMNTSTGLEDEDATHSYASAGTYTITITGDFPSIVMQGSDDAGKLKKVLDWGGPSFGWETFASAFAGCSSLESIPATAPNLTSVSDLSYMFLETTTLNDPDVASWDVSTISNMRGMFKGASAFNQSLNGWSTAAVTDMSSMFSGATSFDQNIELFSWNTANVTDMASMFEGALAFDQYLGDIDVSNVERMNRMLSGSGISGCNYESTLAKWSTGTLKTAVTLGADGLYYFSGTGRTALTTAPHNWIIDGDNQSSLNVCANPDWFITEWKIESSGSTITIPTRPVFGKPYNYDVDWNNDGVFDLSETGYTGDAVHTYAGNGTNSYNQTINIRGDFPTIYFNNNTSIEKDLLLEVKQWGNIEWASFLRSFFGCSELQIFPSVAAPDLSQVISLELMFRDAVKFNGDLSDWDVSNVKFMQSMFQGATAFENGGISNWQNVGTVENVISLNSMFRGATKFNAPIQNWDISSVTSLMRTFQGATTFNQSLAGWDVSQVTTLFETFSAAHSFDQDLSSWNVGLVTNMQSTFHPTNKFNNGGQPFTGNWASSLGAVTNMSTMFKEAKKFNASVIGWDVSEVTTMENMFHAAYEFDQDVSGWDVTKVTTMRNMFKLASKFNNGNVSMNSWERTTAGSSTVANVTSMEGMFFSATQFNQDVQDWNVTGVTNMQAMFAAADAFNKALNNWERTSPNVSTLSNVTDMGGMFNATDIFNQPLFQWNVSSVQNMSSMFSGADAFNKAIDNWDVSSVTNMSYMFKSADVFNQDLNNWNVSNVVNMKEMFAAAPVFNQTLDNWTVSAVKDMSGMFNVATAFSNNSIQGWDLNMITATTGMLKMFDNSGLGYEDYDAILIGWALNSNTPSNVKLGAANLNFCTADNGSGVSTTDTDLEASKSWVITDDGPDCGAMPRMSQSNRAVENTGTALQAKEKAFQVNYTVDGNLLVRSHLKTDKALDLSLYTINGKLIYQRTERGNSGIINTSSLSKGIYILRMNVGSEVAHQKVLIE